MPKNSREGNDGTMEMQTKRETCRKGGRSSGVRAALKNIDLLPLQIRTSRSASSVSTNLGEMVHSLSNGIIQKFVTSQISLQPSDIQAESIV